MKKTRTMNPLHLLLALIILSILVAAIAWAGTQQTFDYANTYIAASGDAIDHTADTPLTASTDISDNCTWSNHNVSGKCFFCNTLSVSSIDIDQNAAITFGDTLIKKGTGTLKLSVANTMQTGATTEVKAGTLEITNTDAIGTGAITIQSTGIFKATNIELSPDRFINNNSGVISIDAALGATKLTASGSTGTGKLELGGANVATFELTPTSSDTECNWVISGDTASKIDFTSTTRKATMKGSMEEFEGTLTVKNNATVILDGIKVGKTSNPVKMITVSSPDATLKLVGNGYAVEAASIDISDATLVIDLTGDNLTYPVIKAGSLYSTSDTKIKLKITDTPQDIPFITLNTPSTLTRDNFIVPAGYSITIDSYGRYTVETQTPPAPEPTPPSNSGFAPATALFNARDGKDLYFQLNGSTRTAMNKPAFRLSLVSEYGKRAALGGDHFKKTDRGIFVSAAFLNSFEEGKYRLEAYDGDKKLSHATLTLVNTSGGGVNPDGGSSSSSGCNTGALSVSLILAAALPLLRRKK